MILSWSATGSLLHSMLTGMCDVGLSMQCMPWHTMQVDSVFETHPGAAGCMSQKHPT